MSYKPSCSKTVFCISQKSLAAGSEHWTLASAQTPLQHCGLGVCPISVLIQRGNWYLQKQHALQLFKLLKFLLWHHKAEAEMKLPQLKHVQADMGLAAQMNKRIEIKFLVTCDLLVALTWLFRTKAWWHAVSLAMSPGLCPRPCRLCWAGAGGFGCCWPQGGHGVCCRSRGDALPPAAPQSPAAFLCFFSTDSCHRHPHG